MKITCGNRQLDLSSPAIMGVLNVTPDSFSDGGQYNQLDAAIERAQQMVEQGATIIDVGGESTRPGATPVSAELELERVVPVVEAISKHVDVCISVDTSTPQVMLESAKVGAHMLNDVRALAREGAIEAAKQTALPICIMHMQGEPKTMQANPMYSQVVNDVFEFLQERINACLEAGIDKSQLMVDPGFGFGKTLEHNYQLLNQLERFLVWQVPLLIGLSRKSMIGAVLGDKPANQRVSGSVAAALIAAQNGANIIRVHDVEATYDAIQILNASRRFAV